jgi:D-sedoheptulose 7-phosphate isomerase
MRFAEEYLSETKQIIDAIDLKAIHEMAQALARVRREGGRLFIIGSGGGAGHASHAVCDFRKVAGIEAYTPSDNVSELTARVNDEGWANAYTSWLEGSRLHERDLLLVFSVGGGDREMNVSPNIVEALKLAQRVGTRITGIVGGNGGYTAKVADVCVLVPIVNPEHMTAHTESFQALIWHLLISDPLLKINPMKWESLSVNEIHEDRS